MNQIAEADLVQIGRAAVRVVAGEDVAEGVEVAAGQDSADHPAYFFSFLIDDDRQRAGLVRIRLLQELRDALVARNDGHYPIVRVLSRADWANRQGA